MGAQQNASEPEALSGAGEVTPFEDIVPTPPSDSTEGSQQKGIGEPLELQVLAPLSTLGLAHTIEGLALQNPRGFGNVVVVKLLANAVHTFERQQEANAEAMNNALADSRMRSDELSKSRTEVAVLNERLGNQSRENRKMQRIRGAAGFAATILLGFAVDFYKNNLVVAAVVIGLIGLGAALFAAVGGWLRETSS